MGSLARDYKAHREGIFAQGFWALTIYRFGHRRFRYTNPLLRKLWGGVHFLLFKWCEVVFGISIHCRATIGQDVSIEHFGSIIVHGHATIGDGCIIRQGVTIGNKNTDRPLEAPTIGSKVDMGAGAKILGAVTVGDDVTIGANAVVITDIPAGSLAVGVPAVIKSKGR